MADETAKTAQKVEQAEVSVRPHKKIELEPSDLLKAGVQFGHELKRWNPKMSKYIYNHKNGIHIIDVSQTVQKLSDAVNFLIDASSRGNVLFVGNKKQAAEIIKEGSVRSGAYFVNSRWAGGLLTNFSRVRSSLEKLKGIEKQFSEGVEGRTKFEVSRMKKEWERLNRLYGGIKTLSQKPTALVVVDANYEKSSIKEAKKIGIPVVAIVDTNSDPSQVDYVIPGNDDALSSIKLLTGFLFDAVLEGNNGKGVVHELIDYSKVEVKINKTKEEQDEKKESQVIIANEKEFEALTRSEPKVEAPARSRTKSKGILEKVKETTVEKKQPVKKTVKRKMKKK